jgi:UDPglucose 6-dehydrogenase
MDVKALITIAKDYDYSFSLLEEVERINDRARRDIVLKTRKMLGDVRGKTIGILGLAFKPNTDDMRDAPSIDIINLLQKDGAKVKAYDPQAQETAKKVIDGITFSKDPYDACREADLAIILTEWNEFKEMDLKKLKELMKSPNIIDARNVFEPDKLKRLGFSYIGVGR